MRFVTIVPFEFWVFSLVLISAALAFGLGGFVIATILVFVYRRRGNIFFFEPELSSKETRHCR